MGVGIKYREEHRKQHHQLSHLAMTCHDLPAEKGLPDERWQKAKGPRCQGALWRAWALRPDLPFKALCPFCPSVHLLGVLYSSLTCLGFPASGPLLMLSTPTSATLECPLSAPFLNPSHPRGFKAQRDSKVEKTWKMIQPYTSVFPEATCGRSVGAFTISLASSTLPFHRSDPGGPARGIRLV